MMINASADDVVMQDVESGGDGMGVSVAVGSMSNSDAAANDTANDTANTSAAAGTNEIDAKDTIELKMAKEDCTFDNQDQSGERCK